MVICGICLNQTNNIIRLSCNHSFCDTCYNSWSRVNSYCPNCPSHGLANLINTLQLFNSDPKDIDIKYPSPKGTSKEIKTEELNLLKEYLGSITKILPENLLNCTNKIILKQSYKSNCWWIGKLVNFENNKLTISNSVCIQRNNGKIYNTSPSERKTTCENKDSFYLVSNG
jgi:hypothetical protein